MTSQFESPPPDLAAAHAMILAERAARLEAGAEAANAKAGLSSTEALISHLKLEIEMAAARSARLGCWSRWSCSSKIWKRPQAKTSWQPKERQPGPRPCNHSSASEAVPRASATRAHRDPGAGAPPPLRFAQDVEARRGHHRDVGGDPAAVEVIQPVREKFSCRDCETITQPPAPFHVTPRGFAGPNWP